MEAFGLLPRIFPKSGPAVSNAQLSSVLKAGSFFNSVMNHSSELLFENLRFNFIKPDTMVRSIKSGRQMQTFSTVDASWQF